MDAEALLKVSEIPKPVFLEVNSLLFINNRHFTGPEGTTGAILEEEEVEAPVEETEILHLNQIHLRMRLFSTPSKVIKKVKTCITERSTLYQV